MAENQERDLSAPFGTGMARTTPPLAITPSKKPKPEPMKASVMSAMTRGLRRSGLSLPYLSIDSA